MAKETTDVRLARIEEQLKATRSDIKKYHEEIVKPGLARVAGHEKEIIGMKRDRWWVGSIMTAIGTLIGIKIGKAG